VSRRCQDEYLQLQAGNRVARPRALKYILSDRTVKTAVADLENRTISPWQYLKRLAAVVTEDVAPELMQGEDWDDDKAHQGKRYKNHFGNLLLIFFCIKKQRIFLKGRV